MILSGTVLVPLLGVLERLVDEPVFNALGSPVSGPGGVSLPAALIRTGRAMAAESSSSIMTHVSARRRFQAGSISSTSEVIRPPAS